MPNVDLEKLRAKAKRATRQADKYNQLLPTLEILAKYRGGTSGKFMFQRDNDRDDAITTIILSAADTAAIADLLVDKLVKQLDAIETADQ